MTPNPLVELSRRRSLVLGSGSPRRVQLLREAGVKFRQQVSSIDENRHPHEDPFVFAERMAVEKAAAVGALCRADEIVLSGDTVVVYCGKVLAKPSDEKEAVSILETLSGQRHTVCTALAIHGDGQLLCSGRETTEVFFNTVSRVRISEYVAGGEPMDKAGAYGIQGMGAFLVDRIEGRLDTVVGLPFALLNSLAREALRLI